MNRTIQEATVTDISVLKAIAAREPTDEERAVWLKYEMESALAEALGIKIAPTNFTVSISLRRRDEKKET